MFSSIPAQKIVSVTPSVLNAGGNPLSLNAVFLSKHKDIPTDNILSFATAQDVSDYFGALSDEYLASKIYFAGFENSNKKPSEVMFYAVNTTAEPAYIKGGSLKNIDLEKLKTYSGNIKITVDGTEHTEEISLASVTSFSQGAEFIANKLNVNCEFNEQLQCYVITGTQTGTSGTITFASGTLADKLKLTQKTGAVLSQGANDVNLKSVMDNLIKQTLNFGTFTTIFEASNEEKTELAEWSNEQLNRFLFVAWDKDESALQANNTACFGAKMKEYQYSGVTVIWGGLDKASFLCGAIASIDFKETNGRATLAFKGQAGLEPDVTNATDAQNLENNGYNYYGAWATANDRFLFFYPAKMESKFKWIDNYINQIRLNSQLQLGLINLLKNTKSIPYNDTGIALQRASCQDAINEAVNFGSIRAGVVLTEQQKAIINQESGFDASSQIETRGYFLLVKNADAETRQNRGSMPMKLWYADGGSVHSISLNSINIL